MPHDLKNELEEMFLDLDDDASAGTGTPDEGGGSSEGGSDDGSSTPPDGVAPEGSAPADQTPPTQEPWKAQMDLLASGQQKLEQMFGQVLEKLDPKGAPASQEETTATDQTTAHELVNQEEFDRILNGDVSTLNVLLNRAVQKGFEQAMLAVPEAVQRRVETSIDSKTQVKMFFNDNQDLVPHRRILGVIAQELVEQRPELSRDTGKLLAEAGKDLRKRFNLAKPAPQQATPTAKPPTDVSGRGNPPARQKVKEPNNDIAAQIAEQFAE